jgi:hypothetical protein
MTYYDGVLSLDQAQNRPLLRLLKHLGAITKVGTLAPAGGRGAARPRGIPAKRLVVRVGAKKSAEPARAPRADRRQTLTQA